MSKYAINTRTPPSKTRTHDECAKHYKEYEVERTAEEALTVKTTETTPLT